MQVKTEELPPKGVADSNWICSNCEQDWGLREGLRRRGTRIKKVWDIGLFCKKCATWQHSFFTSIALEQKRSNVERALLGYQNQIEAMNEGRSRRTNKEIAMAQTAVEAAQSLEISEREKKMGEKAVRMYAQYNRLKRNFTAEFQAFQKRMARMGSTKKLRTGELLYDPYVERK